MQKSKEVFKVDLTTKKLSDVDEVRFSDIHCRERYDLQEWIVSKPSILGEDLLIIQKEFDGFEGTRERLDLLALDKKGNLVIIENKTDDSGNNVVWQAAKYASYCSALDNNQIKEIFSKYLNKSEEDAKKEIFDFVNNANYDNFEELSLNAKNTQRIMLVARKFRKEVITTAYWLSGFGIDISCVEINPLKSDENYFITTRLIFPIKEIKEHLIKLAQKEKNEQDEQNNLLTRYKLRRDFWRELGIYFKKESRLFDNVSFENIIDNWLGVGANIRSGISFCFIIRKEGCAVEFTIATDNVAFNKKTYDLLESHCLEINKKLEKQGEKMLWDKGNGKRSKIQLINDSLSLYNKDQWEEIKKFLTEGMIKFEEVFSSYAHDIKNIK